MDALREGAEARKGWVAVGDVRFRPRRIALVGGTLGAVLLGRCGAEPKRARRELDGERFEVLLFPRLVLAGEVRHARLLELLRREQDVVLVRVRSRSQISSMTSRTFSGVRACTIENTRYGQSS